MPDGALVDRLDADGNQHNEEPILTLRLSNSEVVMATLTRSALTRAALTLALTFTAVNLAPTVGHAEDKVIATINGKAITDADLAVADSEIGADMGSLPEAQKRMSLLEFLIDNQLFAEAAEGEKLNSGPEFENRLTYLKRRALRELYFERVIKSSVSEADARKIYDEQVMQLKAEEEVQARHILVESEEKAKELKGKITAGGDFAVIAKENSKDPGSKDDGGNLGYFGKGQMVPQFEEVVFTLKKGDVSDPVKTQFGWHLIKIEDRRMKPPPAFDIVKDRITQSLLLQKAQQAATTLRAKSKIEFVDADLKKSIEDRNKQIEAISADPSKADPAKTDPAAPAAKPTDVPADDKK